MFFLFKDYASFLCSFSKFGILHLVLMYQASKGRRQRYKETHWK